MTESYLEREVKLDVDGSFRMPDVLAESLVQGTIELVEQQVQSQYYDTARHDLLNARMSLRLRRGSADTGWQLKVPHPPAREEIWVAEAGADVPSELRRLLVGVSRDAPLIPIATVTTQRTLYRLIGPDGEALADIADDRVQATSAGAVATITTWRELEVELGKGDDGLAVALVKGLRKAGARPAASDSKLARAVNGRSREPERIERARDAVLAYAIEQQRAILAGDVALRRGMDAAVHQTRVAARRLRSMLRSYAALFEEHATQPLDQELRWYAGLLGEVRDRQVLRRRLLARIDELPAALVKGPVKVDIDVELAREQAERWVALSEALVGPRYLGLLAELWRWTAAPSWSKKSGKKAAYLEQLARRAARKARRRLRDAQAADDVAEALHDARKAAKRARYAYELLQPLSNTRSVRRKLARLRGLQELLGEHQDSRASAEVLYRMGASAEALGRASGFTLGVLHERENELARAVVKAAAKW
jgi:CHAD domain-containing protein